jgi:hypothetical protein
MIKKAVGENDHIVVPIHSSSMVIGHDGLMDIAITVF